MKSFVFSFFLLLVSSFAFAALKAEPSLTVDALVTEIVAQNPEVKFYEAELAAARAGQRVAGTRAPAELTIEGGKKRARDPRGVAIGEGAAWSVAVSQTFEWPGRLALRKSIANREVQLAELGVERFKSALAAEARTLAYGVQAAAEKAAATAEVAERYRALREIFLARDPAGLTPLLETRVIEAQEIALQRRSIEARVAHRAALVELNRLRGAALEAPLTVVLAKLNLANVIESDRLIAAARQQNFEFRIKQVEIEQQGLAVSLARHERRPAVTVSPFYSSEEAGDRETVVGLGLSVPLPGGERTRGAVEIAEARRRQAEVMLHVAERELDRDVLTAADAYRAKTTEIASWAPDSIGKFREAAALADEHYRLGAVPLGTYVELQSAYLDAVEALLDTQREALAAGLKLQQLTGVTVVASEVQP